MPATFKITFFAFAIVISLTTEVPLTSCKKQNISSACPDADTKPYLWKEVKGMGNGSFQEEWKTGTFPLGLMPVLGPNNHLWMPGQKATWESVDGVNWQKHDKTDWGERISLVYVYFRDTLWMFGGMMYQDKKFVNDTWFSPDGLAWTKAPMNAAWPPRKGHTVVVFKNKLWLYGGSDGVADDLSPNSFLNDTWSSEDGLHWRLEKSNGEWPAMEYPKVLVFNDTLYMLGGQGYGDIWKSVNGKDWILLTADAGWKKRYDHGALVYDDKLWIFGGREEISTNAYNDIWYSAEGVTWNSQTLCAPWTERSGVHSIVFENKLWIFSGKHTRAIDNWGGDIWTME